MPGSDIDSLPSCKHIEKLGEINNISTTNFEESFMEYLSNESPDFLSEFGQCKIGEIDNSIIDDFEDSFRNYFF